MRNDFESNYLMHWGLKKGAKAPNHKYYERVEKNGKYLYFYTQAEYEAWLHQGNSALESAKNKGKELLDKAKNKVNQLKDSNSRQTLANTKQNLVNAVNTGYSQTTNLLAMAQKQLTKSNAQQVIDRGNKAINSALGNKYDEINKQIQEAKKQQEKVKQDFNKSRPLQDKIYDKAKKFDKVQNKVEQFIDKRKESIQNAQNKIYQKAKSFDKVQSKVENALQKHSKDIEKIQNNIERSLSKSGKNIQKVVENYMSKGEKAINKIFSGSPNTSLNQATKQHEQAGSGIVTTILATAAAAVLVTAAKVAIQTFGPKIVEKTKEIMDKIFNPEVKTTIETEIHTATEESQKEYEEKIRKAQEEQRKAQEEQRQKELEKERPKDFSSDCPSSLKEDRAAHSDIPQKDTPTTKDEDMEAINPNYTEITAADYQEIQQCMATYQALVAAGDYEAADRILERYFELYGQYEGYLQNCANCTLTYDMRRRGYDVTASWNPNSTAVDAITDWYKLKDSDILGYESNYRLSKNEINQLEKSIKQQYPEGAYGHLLLYWVDGGGHDVVWSIESGKVVIRDCQNNQVLDFADYAKEANAFQMFRADDKELTDKAYAICTAEKADFDGEPDEDTGYDDPYNNFVRTDDNKVKDVQDFAYDYRKQNKAAGRKKRK